MKIDGIAETCLYVKDLEATREFYSNIMGLKVHTEKENAHVFFRAGRDMLLCFLHGTTAKQGHLPGHHAEGEIHFAFEVPAEEYERWKDRIKHAGIVIEHEEHWNERSSSFYFRDPDRHCVEILKPGLWDEKD